MIAIIDYDAGNVMSVVKAIEHLGGEATLTRDIDVIKNADHVIVPGVGAFEDAMDRLGRYDLIEPIREVAQSGTPIMGICLGLQLFFEGSEESEHNVEGLNLLPGRLYRFPETEGYKIPQIGWNALSIRSNSRLFAGIEDGSFVYFVHSYYLQVSDKNDVAATAEYMIPFDAAVEHDNIFATQFHPEKSGEVGLQILKNFVDI
ncbi:MAG: imidazole glycerol phosphate synthase subunit HisH [Eubacterium sp.]|nr:imidazole glycerol phosphate synthase subunit HisH [Eubacterium sp.]